MIGSEPLTAGDGGANIIDGSDATFTADVLEASRTIPIIVDFWAPWCGPCKQLTPLLEKAVTAAKGAVRLVKIDIDQNPQVAAQLGVQSIPYVIAFFGGQPAAAFQGAQPPAQIEKFVQALSQAGPGADESKIIAENLDAADAALGEGNTADAMTLFGAILEREPGNARALAGLAQCYIRNQDFTRARQILESAPSELAEDAAVQAARKALELAEQAGTAGSPEQHRAKLDADANNHQARYDLSTALLAQGDRVGAVEELIELFRRDRNWNDGAAKTRLLELFESFGENDPATVDGRRQLSTVLFS